MLKANLQGEEATKISLEDSATDLNAQIKALEAKLRKDVLADIDGVVYINEDALSDSTKPYVNIVSKEPLIKSSATEFDILKLSVGQAVKIKVVSTGEEINGTITKIDDLPSSGVGLESTAVAYQFEIKPDKAIKVGFSVEIREDINTLEIPEEYVTVRDEKLFVQKVVETGVEEIEITGTLDQGYYVIDSDKINPGDMLSLNPLDNLGEE